MASTAIAAHLGFSPRSLSPAIGGRSSLSLTGEFLVAATRACCPSVHHRHLEFSVPSELDLVLAGCINISFWFGAVIEAKRGNPPIMPAVMTPGGPLDLSSVLFRNRIIFIGQPVNSQVAQRVISQLVTLATIDEDADILMYLNCPGGSTYSVLAIYDCMSWVRALKILLVAEGLSSNGLSMLSLFEDCMVVSNSSHPLPNWQPAALPCWWPATGHVEDVRRQVNEAVQSRHKIDKMYAAFTGQPLEKVQQYTERDRFFSSSEALEFGLIDGVLETEY
ncbi:hypothetical protein Taro_015849 [Colocasia esculenta]|uniref:ATP-dependent Clp protease proteolytic subunit n=1 Tax=Colocasia esculenta TaxID=4460 RepID=A0A843UR45_COLES|nr:hypothetical protein [Colocasia esculenta]